MDVWLINPFGRYLSDHFGSFEIDPELTHRFHAGLELSTGPLAQCLQQLSLPLDERVQFIY